MWIEMGQTRVLLRQLTNGRQTIDLKGVSAICEDGQGNLWLGGFSWGAIKILAKDVTQANLQQGVLHAQFESFTPKSPVSQALCGWSVRCLIPDGPHTLWIGTIDGGLNRYDLRSQKMSQAGHANQRPQGVWQVRPGQGPWEGYLLVGSDRQGLWLLHRQTGHFQRYGAACLPAESIRDIYQADDTLWLATNEKGVMRMRGTPAGTCEPARRIIAKGTTLKEAYCLLPDGKGHLWARIDEHLYAIDRQREVAVKQYAPQPETNGWFHLNAYYQDPRTGTMYWGKTQGYLVFHPDSLNPHRTAPPVRGVDLSIDHHSVAVGQEVAGHVVLTQHISEAKKIRIPPRTREVALTVVALDYLQPDAFDYRYQLLGYDSTWQWLPAGKQRIAFTNLPVGTYTLRMEAIMGPGGDRVAPTELIIEVLPAYYQTTWFLFLLTAFVLLCVWLLIKRRTHVLHQRNRQLSQKVAERTESLKQAHARIAAQEQARLRFYNDISHELRTPLTLVISPLEGLIEASEDQTERRADLQTIYHNARRMQHIVNQLLAIGRLEEGKWSVEPTAVDASALMSQSLAAFRLYAQQKPVGLHFDGPHEALWVQTDAVKVETILFNLLSNALKYTPPGGQVHLDSRREKDWLILTVRDNGPGIEPAKLAQVFERYVAYGEADKNSDKEPDKPQGSVGLGLAFTRKLVHLLGGGIEIDSEVGQGTEVHVRLPWVPAQAPDSTAPAPAYVSPTMGSHPAEVQHASSPAPRPEPAERPRLLLAEDHPEWRDYLARQLRRDYHVKAVAEGQAAVTAIEAFAPDLIISDVMMPGMDGLALLRRVKGDPAYHHIPVILLTARSEETHLVEGLKQGADDYLAKPVSLTLLRLKVHNLLTLRQHLIRKYQTDPHLDPADFAASQQESEFLQQVFALIEANLNNPALNVDFLASELAMSRSLLFNKLKAVTGKSAKVLIMTHKMKYAATLLGGGRYNVTEVGEKLGYADPSYFAKAFRRYVGKPPSAFLVR
jgi:signal transduction histidine kinase/DNA-binding response OmpR family regulator